jgi:hypothetical protein
MTLFIFQTYITFVDKIQQFKNKSWQSSSLLRVQCIIEGGAYRSCYDTNVFICCIPF